MGTRGRARRGGSEPPLTHRRCGTMQVLFAQLERNPAFRDRLHALEHATQRRLAFAPPPWKVVTIPVVVHVVWRTRAEDVSDAQVKSQVAALNRDFRKKNADVSGTPKPWAGLTADAGVEFELKDVTRTKTDVAAWESDDAMKSSATGGRDPVDPAKHLNLWVCTLAGGLLGYAQFPAGPAKTDGVVILNRAFGTSGTATAPFDRGRTTTHEVGHWLNLRHVWGDTPDCRGGDGVADTPNCEGPNYGKPSFPLVTCGNGPHGGMFMNYMDYVDDEAMFMFTRGQVERMHAALSGPRKSFLP